MMDKIERILEDLQQGGEVNEDWEEARVKIASLIAEERLKAFEFAVLGRCPDCSQEVKNWEAPSGSFAPEAWATLGEYNIDPATGHKNDCELAITLKKGTHE